jgi:hypothetical protein
MSIEFITNTFYELIKKRLSATAQLPLDPDAIRLIQLELVKMYQKLIAQLNEVQEIAVLYNPVTDQNLRGYHYVIFDCYGKYKIICSNPFVLERFQNHVQACIDINLTLTTGELQILSEYEIMKTFADEFKEYFTFAYYKHNRNNKIVSFDFAKVG